MVFCPDCDIIQSNHIMRYRPVSAGDRAAYLYPLQEKRKGEVQWFMYREKLIKTALGECEPDLVLKNGKVIQVLTGEILLCDIAISDGRIAGLGNYKATNTVDLQGRYVSPGFINSHCHVESSMALPERYCAEELRFGVTTVITDPHEIANVCGAEGIRFMLERSRQLPINYFVQVPSCVPSTKFEHAGSVLSAEDLREFLDHPGVTGLGEVMDFRGVAACDPELLRKISLFEGKVLDGHLPTVPQQLLQPYAAAGIQTDHESVTFGEAREKLRAGMYVLIREGSGSKNLQAIVEGIVREGLDTSRLAFCTDDKHLADIHREGTIRKNIQMAIQLGMAPVAAYQLATINAARIYGLSGIGAVAPGYRADLVILDSLKDVTVFDVYKDGKPFNMVKWPDAVPVPESILHSVRLPHQELSFHLPEQKDYSVIRMIPKQIITGKETLSAEEAKRKMSEGELLKIAVIERHHATGNMGVGLLAGYGLKNGAIATTVAHDSHNLIVAGDNDRDMLAAVHELERVQGGYTLVRGGKPVATLSLPVAGLMSPLETDSLIAKIRELSDRAHQMGVFPDMDPFIALSFLALPVLPEIRITDMGVLDVF